MKYIAYCRKSSEAEEKQALSIESQERELIKFAEKEGITIDKTLRESMSAKSPGRPVFNKILELIRKGEAQGVVAWHPNRLSRNAVDAGQLIQLFDEGILEAILTPGQKFYNSPTDKFVFGLLCSQAKLENDNKGVNVKRGLRTKLEKGGWPGTAPFGYLNDKINKTIILDQERMVFIVRMFTLYATGGYSIKDIEKILYNEGLRTLSGYKVRTSKIHTILSNPFYFGFMVRGGKFYKGNHKPIISKELFDKVDNVIHGRHHSKKQKHLFPLRGFMNCNICGCLLTATQKKGHIYYYCTNGKGNCEQHKKYMRSEFLDKNIANIFDKIYFDEELIEMAYNAKKEKTQKGENYFEMSKKALDNQLILIKQKQTKLLDSYLSSLIPKNVYKDKIQALNNEQITTDDQVKKLANGNNNSEESTLEPIKNIFLTANRAKKEFLKLEDCQKHQVLETLLWNLRIENQKVASYKLKMPYHILAKAPQNRDFAQLLAWRDSFRTFDWVKALPVPELVIRNIRQLLALV